MLDTKWHLRFKKVERKLLKFHFKKEEKEKQHKRIMTFLSLIHCTICLSCSATILLIGYCPNIKSNFKILKFISYLHSIKSGIEICKFIKLNEHIFPCQTHYRDVQMAAKAFSSDAQVFEIFLKQNFLNLLMQPFLSKILNLIHDFTNKDLHKGEL